MRLPYPERFEWKSVFFFGAILLILQLAAGTSPEFVGLTAVYLLLFTGAFNAGGGMYYASGAWIFFTGTLVVLVGIIFKALLFEPGESHLQYPNLTLLIDCGGMAVMWLAVHVSKLLTPRRGLLKMARGRTMMQAAVGSLILGFLFQVAFGSGGTSSGSVGSAVAQLNRFPEFAIILGTTYEIYKSEGKRAHNWVVVTGVLLLFSFGVIYTSKEGMFLGPVTWLITAMANRFDFKAKYLLVGGLAGFFLVYYMVPYSQYVRTFRDKNGLRSANQEVALEYIFRLNDVRALYLDQEEAAMVSEGPHFYDRAEGLMDRLCALPMDDALVSRTEDGYVYGLAPTIFGVLNTVPRFLYPGKPNFFTGNEYGREIGILSPDDVTTGISFSPAIDAYHQAKWFGLFAVFPLVCFAYFLSNDSVAGSVKDSPFPLLLILLASHLAPEGMIDGMILQVVEGSIALFFTAGIIRFVFPMVYRVLTGGEKTVVRKTMDFRLGSKPLRNPPVEPDPSATR